MSSPRPCTYCGHGEFLLMPRIAIDMNQGMLVGGAIAACASIQGQWTGNVYVCTRCTHTTFFTLNGPAMMQRVKDAVLVKAQGA